MRGRNRYHPATMQLLRRLPNLRRLPHRQFLRRALLALALLYVTFAGFIWWAMRQPPETFGRVMTSMPQVAYFLVPFETMWTRARAGTLHPGDPAPDFSLLKLDKSSSLRLSELAARQPVVLVFGSYT